MRRRGPEGEDGAALHEGGDSETRRGPGLCLHRVQVARPSRPGQQEGDGRPAAEGDGRQRHHGLRHEAYGLWRLQDTGRGLTPGAAPHTPVTRLAAGWTLYSLY